MEDKPSELDAVCDKLDVLTLDQVELLEEQLLLMNKLSNHLSSGFIDMAKSRYIRGEKSVSALQIPGEESETNPIATVLRDTSNQFQIARDPKGTDPIKWFGVLVPTSLRQSQQAFQQVLETAVELLNVRSKWLQTVQDRRDLSSVKNDLL